MSTSLLIFLIVQVAGGSPCASDGGVVKTRKREKKATVWHDGSGARKELGQKAMEALDRSKVSPCSQDVLYSLYAIFRPIKQYMQYLDQSKNISRSYLLEKFLEKRRVNFAQREKHLFSCTVSKRKALKARQIWGK